MERYQQYQRELLETAGRVSYRQFPIQEQTAQAFLAAPRHLFIPRTRLFGSWVDLTPANLNIYLEFLYRDVPLALMEDKAGNVVSTISQPSFVLLMLDLLRLEPGQTVFELGTGSGWNAALLGYLVGEQGLVDTAEIIPEMALAARENLRKLGIGNVTVITGDFDTGLPRDIMFDRVMFTAGGSDLPHFLFEQVKQDGLVLFPFKVQGGGDILYLLRKQQDHYESIYTIDCAFVPVTGKYHIPSAGAVLLTQIPGWAHLQTKLLSKLPIGEWGIPTNGGLTNKTHPFRFFLSISEPGYFALRQDENGRATDAFGLWDDESLVICNDDQLIAYGSHKARERFLDRVHQWSDLGMTGYSRFQLNVYPVEKNIVAGEDQWLVKRKEAQFLWTVGG